MTKGDWIPYRFRLPPLRRAGKPGMTKGDWIPYRFPLPPRAGRSHGMSNAKVI